MKYQKNSWPVVEAKKKMRTMLCVMESENEKRLVKGLPTVHARYGTHMAELEHKKGNIKALFKALLL